MLSVRTSPALVVVSMRGCEPGSGEDIEAEVAAAFGPFVVLFGGQGADEADQRIAVREDPDDVRCGGGSRG